MTRPYLSLALRERVTARARGRCEYCCSPARYSPEVFEVEHIVHDLTRIIGQTASGRATVELLRMNRPAVCHFRTALRESGLHPAIAD